MLLLLLLMSMFGPVFFAIHFSELVTVTVFFAPFVEVTLVWAALFLFLDFRFSVHSVCTHVECCAAGIFVDMAAIMFVDLDEFGQRWSGYVICEIPW